MQVAQESAVAPDDECILALPPQIQPRLLWEAEVPQRNVGLRQPACASVGIGGSVNIRPPHHCTQRRLALVAENT